MNGIYLGIDVGGTHTDGVAVENGRILRKAKVPTRGDLVECTLDALETLLEGLNPRSVRRVVLSTTLVTNAIVQGRLEPTGTLLTAGPGIDPAVFAPDDRCRVVGGAVDHRGREVAPLDEAAARDHLNRFARDGVRVLAVVGKFSTRNPSHELRLAELAGDRFDYVAQGHRVAGTLNFPRRVATAYLAAGAWRIHREFVEAMTAALRRFSVLAPLYVLRADGGTQMAAALANPAETALSGPAASVMGVDALGAVDGDTLSLDIGGTTTDISVFTGDAALIEPRGATVGSYRTQLRAVYTRSTGAGGDSCVRIGDGRVRLGPDRCGPPAAFGGPQPTPTDALVVLGRILGDRHRAADALGPVARGLDVPVEAAARAVLRELGRSVAASARRFLDEVNSRPVYTIHELLGGHRVRPLRAVAVGGPARAAAPYLEEALDLPVRVPEHFDVANAVGAALARVNVEVHLVADTARGYLSIPQVDAYERIDRRFSLEDARQRIDRAVLDLARARGALDPDDRVERVDEESFNVIQGFSTAGAIHRLRAQIRPGILARIA